MVGAEPSRRSGVSLGGGGAGVVERVQALRSSAVARKEGLTRPHPSWVPARKAGGAGGGWGWGGRQACAWRGGREGTGSCLGLPEAAFIFSCLPILTTRKLLLWCCLSEELLQYSLPFFQLVHFQMSNAPVSLILKQRNWRHLFVLCVFCHTKVSTWLLKYKLWIPAPRKSPWDLLAVHAPHFEKLLQQDPPHLGLDSVQWWQSRALRAWALGWKVWVLDPALRKMPQFLPGVLEHPRGQPEIRALTCHLEVSLMRISWLEITPPYEKAVTGPPRLEAQLASNVQAILWCNWFGWYQIKARKIVAEDRGGGWGGGGGGGSGQASLW